MTIAGASGSAGRSLRLWPGVVFAALVLLTAIVVPVVVPGGGIFAVLGGIAGGVLILLWWLFFSRAPWLDRLGAIAVMIAAVLATSLVVDKSVSNGMMGGMLYVFSIPLLSVALVTALVLSRGRTTAVRRASVVIAVLLACVVMTLVRTGGVSGDGVSDLHWRWTPTPEDRLLAQAAIDLPPVPRCPRNRGATKPSHPAVWPRTRRRCAATSGARPPNPRRRRYLPLRSPSLPWAAPHTPLLRLIRISCVVTRPNGPAFGAQGETASFTAS